LIQAFAARCGMMSLALTAFATLLLSACAPSVPYGLPSGRSLPPPATGTQIPAEGEVIGTGDIRVALLLPLSAEGNGAQVAAEMKNAAQLALEHSGLDALELVIKDTGGTEAGAAAAAQSAARERAGVKSVALKTRSLATLPLMTARSLAGARRGRTLPERRRERMV